MHLIAFITLTVLTGFIIGNTELMKLGSNALGPRGPEILPMLIIAGYGLLLLLMFRQKKPVENKGVERLSKSVDDILRGMNSILGSVKTLREEGIKAASDGALVKPDIEQITKTLRLAADLDPTTVDRGLAAVRKLGPLLEEANAVLYDDDGDPRSLDGIEEVFAVLKKVGEALEAAPTMDIERAKALVGGVGDIAESISSIQQDHNLSDVADGLEEIATVTGAARKLLNKAA